MKLVPKAKPIRIRINSGGVDHSSIESLKNCFCINDLLQVPIESLKKWLCQQGNYMYIEVIYNYLCGVDIWNEQSVVGFANLIFSSRDGYDDKNLSGLLAIWDRDGYKDNIMLWFSHMPSDAVIAAADSELMNLPSVRECIESCLKKNAQNVKASEDGDSEVKETLRINKKTNRQGSALELALKQLPQLPSTNNYTIQENSVFNKIYKKWIPIINTMKSPKTRGKLNWDAEINSLSLIEIYCPTSFVFVTDACRLYRFGGNIDEYYYPADWYDVLMKVKRRDWTSFVSALNYIDKKWQYEALLKLRGKI